MGPCAPRPGCSGWAGACRCSVASKAKQAWERKGGYSPQLFRLSQRPSCRELGERSQATRCPLTDGLPLPTFHRHSPRVTEGLPEAVAPGVCGYTCLSPPRWWEGGRDPGVALRQPSGATACSPQDLSLLHPAPLLPAGASQGWGRVSCGQTLAIAPHSCFCEFTTRALLYR